MNRPNILIFMTDQQRGDTIPPYSRAKTPNLDEFCKHGISFDRTYCSAPHCCPCRASFYTGLYPSQHGVWNNVNVGNTLSRGIYEGVRLFSEDLKDSGYNLYFSGKWHISNYESPEDKGWTMSKAPKLVTEEEKNRRRPTGLEWDKFYRNLKLDTSKRGRGQIKRPGYSTYNQYGTEFKPHHDLEVVADAKEILKNRPKSDKPWCQFVGNGGPHDPYFVPQKYIDMYDINDIQLPKNYNDTMFDKPNLYRRTRDRFDQLTSQEHKESILHYLALCTYEDALFGEVLQALDGSGERENTLVIYLSDHGDYCAEHGLWCKGLPCFQGAYHIPAAIRWPKGLVNPGRIVHDFISITDFAPTFLELAKIKRNREFVGESLVPFIKDKKPEKWRDALFTQTNGNELYGIQRSIMTDEWKFVYNGYDYDELYNLKEDPYEMKNVINDPTNREIIKELSKRLWKFALRTNDVCINPYIMVGLAQYGPGIAMTNN